MNLNPKIFKQYLQMEFSKSISTEYCPCLDEILYLSTLNYCNTISEIVNLKGGNYIWTHDLGDFSQLSDGSIGI